jgi:hypothetical protein
MQLDILFDTPTLEEMSDRINVHFNQTMKVHQEKMSMFESYQVRPVDKFIPEIWKYRIVCRNGKYYFGTIKS